MDMQAVCDPAVSVGSSQNREAGPLPTPWLNPAVVAPVALVHCAIIAPSITGHIIVSPDAVSPVDPVSQICARLFPWVHVIVEPTRQGPSVAAVTDPSGMIVVLDASTCENPFFSEISVPLMVGVSVAVKNVLSNVNVDSCGACQEPTPVGGAVATKMFMPPPPAAFAVVLMLPSAHRMPMPVPPDCGNVIEVDSAIANCAAPVACVVMLETSAPPVTVSVDVVVP